MKNYIVAVCHKESSLKLRRVFYRTSILCLANKNLLSVIICIDLVGIINSFDLQRFARLNCTEIKYNTAMLHAYTCCSRITRYFAVSTIVIVPYFIESLIILNAVSHGQYVTDIIPLTYQVIKRHVFRCQKACHYFKGAFSSFLRIVRKHITADPGSPYLFSVT